MVWPMPRPILIGIGGGTASGKTTLVDKIAEAVLPLEVAIVREDWYYKDQSQLEMSERINTNYDHPDSFDTELLIEHLGELITGKNIDCPTYDFPRHTRGKATVVVDYAKVIILEGLLVLHDARLRQMMDIKMFVDTDPDLRIIRRIKRDVTERGRTFDSVTDRYIRDVRPMHIKFVEPTKFHADLVIPFGTFNSVVVDVVSVIVSERYAKSSR